MSRIYLDHASTTPPSSRVVRAMRPFWRTFFGNPSSIHAEGVQANRALKDARGMIARFFECQKDEVVFTGSGTASNNLALLGAIEAQRKEGREYADMHIMTTTIEHSSVLEVFRELETRGVKATYLPVRSNGRVDVHVFESAIRENTVLVSIGYVNGEVGTIQPIGKLSTMLRKKNTKALFHTDASQAPEYIPVLVNTLGVDLCTIDGQKMYGPKGVAVLFVKQGTSLAPLLFGGGQEKGLVSGTENISLIVGLATACIDAAARRDKESKRMEVLQEYAFNYIEEKLPQALINGDREKRIPNNIHVSLPGIDTEFLVIQLDQKGIACATKSACDSNEPRSYVIHELYPEDSSRAESTLRISFGRSTRKRHVRAVVKAIQKLCI